MVYNHDALYAREHGELDAYRKSNDLNRECKRVIEQVIRDGFDGMRLDRNAVDKAIETCGTERVAYVLANTVQQKMYDGRFGRDVKEWAQRTPVESGSSIWFVVGSHPAVLDGFIRQFIQKCKI